MGRKLFVPEVLQTSGMDCGPAALKALLGGLGVVASYERLRDACQTGADGTSLDALEDLASGLGLEAFQEMAPMADALDALAARAPCIVVVKGVGGSPHFIVLHALYGGIAQIMDPATGRRFVRRATLAQDLFVHEQRFDDADFAAWWPGTEWAQITTRRVTRRGWPSSFALGRRGGELATVDAAARFAACVERRGASAGDAARVFHGLLSAGAEHALPRHAMGARSTDDGGILARGALFLVVRGSRAAEPAPHLRRVLGSEGPSALSVVASLLRERGRGIALAIGLLVIATALVSLAEMVFLRAAFNARSLLSLPHQRFAGTALYAVLVAAALGLDVALGLGVLRAGRLLELSTRVALLTKLPRLPDRYFRTRPMSDVTHRSQGLFELKALPDVLLTVFKHALDIVVTVTAIIVVYPAGAPFALLALVSALVIPILSLKVRRRVELRVQSHASALGQLYLDALMGLVPLRTHGARLSLSAKQEEHLAPWRTQSARALGWLTATDALQSMGTLGAVALLLLQFTGAAASTSTLLLLSFWSLRLPLQARALSAGLQRVPELTASISRVAEPLTAEETPPVSPGGDGETLVLERRRGVAVELRSVSVTLGTNRVLDRVSLAIRSGERVAVVGSSGAGKSSLVSCILGLLEPGEGDVRIDGQPLARFDVGRLRRETVWVDPAVQLWNRPLVDNLMFGNPRGARGSFQEVLERPEIREVVERMPRGMATELGESGARVSGGEGQRVRLARALLRRGARLILLDEAFRGLDRATRRALSRSVHAHAKGATVVEVTHDVADTREFDRVVVIEDGRLVEQGRPAELLAAPSSRYLALVTADASVQRKVWDGAHWRRHLLHGDGRITAVGSEELCA